MKQDSIIKLFLALGIIGVLTIGFWPEIQDEMDDSIRASQQEPHHKKARVSHVHAQYGCNGLEANAGQMLNAYLAGRKKAHLRCFSLAQRENLEGRWQLADTMARYNANVPVYVPPPPPDSYHSFTGHNDYITYGNQTVRMNTKIDSFGDTHYDIQPY